MAHARLHMICGNCGCNNDFEHRVKEELNDITDEMQTTVYIFCRNCSTLHNLENNSKLISLIEKSSQT
jgi:uncharacterized Zn finger protein